MSRKDTEKLPNLHEWAKIDYKKLANKMVKSGINKQDWTLENDFDVLKNYIQFHYILCELSQRIFYYDKENATLEATKNKNERGEPSDKAKYALFNLNILKNIKNPEMNYLYCLFKRNSENEKWNFEKIISREDKCWNYTIRDINKLSMYSKFEITGDKIPPIEKLDFKDIYFNTNHIFEKKENEDTNKERIKRFLPESLRSILNEEYTEFIIESIIGYNIYNIYKIDKIEDIKKECLMSWPIMELNRENLVGVNFMFPLRIKDDICGALVLRATSNNGKLQLTTILDLEQAYKGAKLYDPRFSSEWLTIDNVNKAIKLGCIENLNF